MPTFAEYSSVVGTCFRARVSEAGEAVSFELTQATPNRAPANASSKPPEYESFSLLFRGPGQKMLAQGTYDFEHERLGTFPMFIVPVSRETESVVYQAVFNQLVTPPLSSGS
jgi:hypothetical protein